MRTQPFFLDTYPRSRRPDYPRQRGETHVAAVIVGGGLTGCACAAAFSLARIDVVLLEAERIGSGATAGSAGLVRQDFDAAFQQSAQLHGLRVARHAWESMRRASLDLGATIRRLGVRCDLEDQDLLRLARGVDAKTLQREYQARRDAGLDVTWLSGRVAAGEVGTTSNGAIRVKGAVLDPYRACVGLAAAAAKRGAVIHERSTVRRIRARRKHVEIRTDGGTITADTVVIATGALIDDLRALRRHFSPRQSFGVVTAPLPAAVRRDVGRRRMALSDSAKPPHLLRWLKGDRVLFAGAEQAPVAPRTRDKMVVPAAMELMYELTTIYPAISGVQPEWAWAIAHYASPDGLPVIGPHRNFPRHLFALGLDGHGPGSSWLAARVLARAAAGEPAKGDETLGFSRVL
jgi:glycine/D-amino acid oxidase-like deaminating enzyme